MSTFKIPAQSAPTYYVYAVLCRDGDGPLYIKFGHSMQVANRLTQLKSGCPIPVHYFAISEVGRLKGTALDVEKALHTRFDSRRTQGEWFKFDFENPDDKRDFNDGCRQAFMSVLGHHYQWWTKISARSLEAYGRERRRNFLKSRNRKKLMRRAEQERRRKQAWKELDAWGKTG